MTNLTIVTNIVTKPKKIELVKSELVKLIDVTRAEVRWRAQYWGLSLF